MSWKRMRLVIVLLFLFVWNPVVTEAGIMLENEELETFVDKEFENALSEREMPGAIFIAVQDGRTIVNKGYGYADIDSQLPVTDQTLFRIGSVSKIFTTTAVLQLAEQKQLALKANINRYVPDISVKNPYGSPITIEHLLTHTAGFDEKFISMSERDYNQVQQLESYLEHNMPALIRPPGEEMQYSNHGFALAGLVVEKVSGVPYHDYMERNIFEPLHMSHSFVRLKDAPIDNVAREYGIKDGDYIPLPLYDFNIAPAGSILSTGADMAKFMNFQLNGEESILTDEWLEEMHQQQFVHDDGMEGMAYGFFEKFRGDERFLVHGGDTNGTHSFLFLDPKRNFGFFTSNTAMDGALFNETFINRLLERFYPIDSAAFSNSLPEKDYHTDMKAFTGDYRILRYSRDGLEKMQLLLNPPMKVVANDEGRLTISFLGMNDTYLRTADKAFQHISDRSTIKFAEKDGNMHLYAESQALEKMAWHESPVLHMALLGIFLLLFLIGMIATIMMPVGRKLMKRPQVKGKMEKRFDAFLGALSVLNVLFVFGILYVLLSMQQVMDILFGVPSAMKLLLVIPFITTVLIVVFLGLFIKNGKMIKPGRRIWIGAFLVAGIGMNIILYYYNLYWSGF